MDGSRQWTRSGEPLVRGGGVSDKTGNGSKRRSAATAKNKSKHRKKPRARTVLDKRGASRPVKNVSPSQSEESADGSDSPQTRRRNATEMQETPDAKAGGSWSASDLEALVKSVPVYKAKYSAIYAAIQSGAIPMEKKDRSQQSLRAMLRSMKTKYLKSDDKLPAGFDHIRGDSTLVRIVSAVHKNPWRKEADVDSSGEPTNTQWDPAQDPARKDGAGLPQVVVAQGEKPRTTRAKAGSSAKKVRSSSERGGNHVQPSPDRPSPAGQEGTGRQQVSPAQQGQQASTQEFRSMVPSETVKPGRKGRNVQHDPRQ